MRSMVLALGLALPVAATTMPPAMAVPMSSLAPADRYFGRMKMSILGIRNSLKDLTADADLNPQNAGHIYDKVVFVDDALRDWHRHYPRDPWIPKYAYALASLYGKLGTGQAHAHRVATMRWIAASFPRSQYAQLAHG